MDLSLWDIVAAVSSESGGGGRAAKAKAGGADTSASGRSSLSKLWLKPISALIVTKSQPGFDRATIDDLAALLAAIGRGELSDLKFLVFDFAHGNAEAPPAGDGFEELVAANAELILDTPVITLAWARSLMIGADLDFALHCSMIVAQSDARFSFAGDPFSLFGLYAALGRKIGFMKAERLIENNEVLNANEMIELLIVKDVVEPAPGSAGVEAYLAQFGRRYNASHAIFRAQRLAMPLIERGKSDGALRR